MAVRPIDGNELVDTLKQIISDYTSHGMYPSAFPVEYAIEIVEKMPTLTPPNEWVSVENALPEECADILLCRKILKIPEIGTYQQARFWVYDEIGDVYQVDDVTHWLPIPTPYDIEHIHISEPPEG